MAIKNSLLKLLAIIILLGFQQTYAQYNFSKLDEILLSKKRAFGGNVCLLIYKDDKTIYENNLGDYNKNTAEPIASCSKWLTAALVMTFVDEGKISVDDYVGKYLPEFSKGDKAKIKIRHCLSHTTGIHSEPITMRLLMARKKYKSLTEEVADFANEPLIAEPGQAFAYSNIGLNVVGHILEVISGKDFETLFQERIAKPIEMTSTTFIGKQVYNPSGGATSTASDYIKFLSMILHKGNYNGKQVLSEKSVELMQTSKTENAKVLYVPDGGKGFEYAFGEWVQEKDNSGKSTFISSPGLFGTYPFIDIKRNYAAIVFVKNLKVRNRRENNLVIKQAVDEALQK
jgi:CubicO group peptidase (beta-lactamase class C family)